MNARPKCQWQTGCRRIGYGACVCLVMILSGCGGTDRESASSTKSDGESVERTTEKGPVKLVVRVRPREPRLSDLVELELVATTQASVEIKPPTFGLAVGDFLVRDYSERPVEKSGSSADQIVQRRFVYKLEPIHAGHHLIRSFAVEFVDNRPTSEQKGVVSVIESEPFDVNVTSELGDQVPNLADLEPMLPPRPLEKSSRNSWMAALIVLGLILVLVLWLRRRKARQSVELVTQTPEEIAHAAFAALLSENLPGRGLFKEFYLRLTGIVRHYIEGTTGLHAPEQTTEEFLRAMRACDVFTLERSTRLKEFLEAADMVKYAGQQPDNDQIELAISRAREFVSYRSPVTAAPVNDHALVEGN